MTDPFSNGGNTLVHDISGGSRWTIGPTLEVRLPFRLGVEVDAFYRRLEGTSSSTQASATANSWSFPILLKWRILPGPVQPYVGAGPVFDWVSGVHVDPGTLGFNVGNSSVSRSGATIAGGVELHAGRLKISPELRYSHYSQESLVTSLGSLVNLGQNQAAFLVGITF